MQHKIAFLCNWGNSSAELLIFLARQTPGGSGIWNDLQGVATIAEADFVVVLEDLPTSISSKDIKLDKAIFLPREPIAVRRRKDYQTLRAPLAFTHDDIHQAAVWRIMSPFDELAASAYAAKSRLLSSVTSAANETLGHQMRIGFLQDFAHRYPGKLDVYGYGWNGELGASFKGELGNRFGKITDFPALCKLDGLRDYRYALAFENCRQHNYFSEKLVDCWLAWTMPIYWGCPNLSDYFPEDSFHEIDPASHDCVDRVAEIIARPINARQIAAMHEARQLILEKYNIWATIEDIVAGRRPNAAPQRTLLQRLAAFVKGP